MKRGVLLFALALSLLFNVFFAVGYIRARNLAHLNQDGAVRVSQEVARELQLDEEQKKIFHEMRERIREETAVFDEGIGLAREELAAELDRSESDLDKIDEIMERISGLHREKRRTAFGVFEEFKKVLTPEQRDRLSRHMHRGPRHRGKRGDGRGDRSPGDRFRQYDRNQDGMLDETEQAEYERDRAERMKKWQERRERRMREMLERYDTNGDGTLDEQEREAIPREERWRGRRGSRGGSWGGGPPGRGPGPGDGF
ncbi:MAG: Spy/CpxP family protein refolding chaperone [Planctomycetota bacterium]|jgi:Spy/CpxP family protein refolding chaperone